MGLTPLECWTLAGCSAPFLVLVALTWKRGGIVAVSGLGIVLAATGWIAYWMIVEGPPKLAPFAPWLLVPMALSAVGFAMPLEGLNIRRIQGAGQLRVLAASGALLSPVLMLWDQSLRQLSILEVASSSVLGAFAWAAALLAGVTGSRRHWAAALASAFLAVLLLIAFSNPIVRSGSLSLGIGPVESLDRVLPGVRPETVRILFDRTRASRAFRGEGWALAYEFGKPTLVYSLGPVVPVGYSWTTDSTTGTRMRRGPYAEAEYITDRGEQVRQEIPADSLLWLPPDVRVISPWGRARRLAGPAAK